MPTIDNKEMSLFEKDYHLLGDFFDFFCGEWLGEGECRVVYEFRLNTKMVVKICKSGFDNIHEWEIYKNIKYHHPHLVKYLAQPIRISECGKVLLMERTQPIKHLPKKIPQFITDLHPGNWGKIGNRIVCHDYANHRLFKDMNTKVL
jgi:hypothetical protein